MLAEHVYPAVGGLDHLNVFHPVGEAAALRQVLLERAPRLIQVLADVPAAGKIVRKLIVRVERPEFRLHDGLGCVEDLSLIHI